MGKNNNNETLSTEHIVNHFSDNPNSTLFIVKFEKGEFYENNLTGKIKEAFCFKTNYPEYKGEPLYVIYEDDSKLFEWFASDDNNEYFKEKEYSKYIIDWKNNLKF